MLRRAMDGHLRQLTSQIDQLRGMFESIEKTWWDVGQTHVRSHQGSRETGPHGILPPSIDRAQDGIFKALRKSERTVVGGRDRGKEGTKLAVQQNPSMRRLYGFFEELNSLRDGAKPQQRVRFCVVAIVGVVICSREQ